MKKYKYILLVACIAMLPCMGGYADDVIDDVYYWESDLANTPAENELPYRRATITFIEDSITLHSDTVVRAIIHRY